MVAHPGEQAGIRSASPEYYMERYEQEEDRWSDVSMESPLAIKFVARVQSLASSRPSLTVLDAGCGRLGVAFMLRKVISNLKIVAIDFAYRAIVQTHIGLATKAERAGITFLDSNFMEFDWERRFDIIVDFGLLHHLTPSDWPQYQRSVDRLLEWDGTLFIRAFHPSDRTWGHSHAGGYVRRGYYCHYHTLDSLQNVIGNVLPVGHVLAQDERPEHVEWLYEFRRHATVRAAE